MPTLNTPNGTTDVLTRGESAERLPQFTFGDRYEHFFSCRGSSQIIGAVVRETRDVKKYAEQASEKYYEFGRHFWVGWFLWMSGCSQKYAGFQHC
jgi:hypothetical protein